jgi:hypothetical protein
MYYSQEIQNDQAIHLIANNTANASTETTTNPNPTPTTGAQPESIEAVMDYMNSIQNFQRRNRRFMYQQSAQSHCLHRQPYPHEFRLIQRTYRPQAQSPVCAKNE